MRWKSCYSFPTKSFTKSSIFLFKRVLMQKCCKVKVTFQPVNTGRGTLLPLEANWARLIFFVVRGSLHLLHNEGVTFPSLPVPIYTPGWREVIIIKCLTQGHNTLTVTGHEPPTFCLWIQYWSARPHAPTKKCCIRLKRICIGGNTMLCFS